MASPFVLAEASLESEAGGVNVIVAPWLAISKQSSVTIGMHRDSNEFKSAATNTSRSEISTL